MTASTESPAASQASAARAERPMVLHARVVSGAGGGPEKTILNSPRFLDELGYRSICAYMRHPDDAGYAAIESRAARYDAPLESISDRGPFDWRVLRDALRLCKRERVAIWHGHDYKSNLLGWILRRFWPMRLVTTAHGWVKHTSRTPLYYRIDKFCLPRYDRVICVSGDLREECLACGVSPDRLALIENAIDTEEYTRDATPADAKRRLGFAPDRLLIGAVGRLSAEKAFDALVRSVDRLIEHGFDVELAIVGDGDARASLEELVDELGRKDRIRLLGYRSDVKEIYQAMNVYALSSLREGLPNVLLEAMALETPVVATRIAGVPRLIDDGANGLLVDPGSVDQLTAALRRLLENETLRTELAAAARRTIVGSYGFDERMRKVAGVYDEVLAGVE